MSRLDSFIRRVRAQRACLNHAAELIKDMPGPLLELGLGNGRTYDHLRELMPQRDIYVFDRQLAAHADCIPPREFLILGDGRKTLRTMWGKIPHAAALAHVDIGTGDVRENQRLAAELMRLIAPLMRQNSVVVGDPSIDLPGWHPLPLPTGVRKGRYHIYRLSLGPSRARPAASPPPERHPFQSPCVSEIARAGLKAGDVPPSTVLADIDPPSLC
jgi:S-adenosylmethionine-dependent methyltransferase